MLLRGKTVFGSPLFIHMRDAPIMLGANGTVAGFSRFEGTNDSTIVATPDWKAIGDAPLVVALRMVRPIPPYRHDVDFATLSRLYEPRTIRQAHEIRKLGRPHFATHV